MQAVKSTSISVNDKKLMVPEENIFSCTGTKYFRKKCHNYVDIIELRKCAILNWIIFLRLH